MSNRIPQYSNEVWIAALRDDAGDATLPTELAGYIRRVLASTLARRGLSDDELEELTQEAMAQLLGALHTFRGDSAFTTWAAAVATRVAFTELRRRVARRTQHAAFAQAKADALSARAGDAFSDALDVRRDLMDALHASIQQTLTDRQRIATLALLRGVPTIEIAEQLNSNQNAVYKLVHDARLRLREALERRGFTAEVFEEAAMGEQR